MSCFFSQLFSKQTDKEKTMPITRRTNTPSPNENLQTVPSSTNPSNGQPAQKNNSNVTFEFMEPRYTLDHIIASPRLMSEIRSLIALKRDFEIVFEKMGFRQTHKYSKKFILNFYGEPGTGKTIAAHAIAHALGKQILLVDYSQIESKYVGETPKNLKRIFEFAEENPCLIFFDEADAILSRRVTNMSSATDTSVNQTRSVLLNILNDFEGDLIFATNFISNYDPAFMRRISKHIYFELPDTETRVKLLQKYTPTSLHRNLNFEAIAKSTENLSAADIEKGMLMAAFHASGQGRDYLIQADISQQMEAILKSKLANQGNGNIKPETKFVSHEYIAE